MRVPWGCKEVWQASATVKSIIFIVSIDFSTAGPSKRGHLLLCVDGSMLERWAVVHRSRDVVLTIFSLSSNEFVNRPSCAPTPCPCQCHTQGVVIRMRRGVVCSKKTVSSMECMCHHAKFFEHAVHAACKESPLKLLASNCMGRAILGGSLGGPAPCVWIAFCILPAMTRLRIEGGNS